MNMHYISAHIGVSMIIAGFAITAAGLGWGLVLGGMFLAVFHGGCYFIDEINSD